MRTYRQAHAIALFSVTTDKGSHQAKWMDSLNSVLKTKSSPSSRLGDLGKVDLGKETWVRLHSEGETGTVILKP